MILVYASIILIVLYDIKIFKFVEYNSNALSMKNSNAIKGLAAIVVVLHHISQRVNNIESVLFFKNLGYLSVSMFFFYSGYGLMKSYDSKENYLNGFWINRMPKIIIPFILSNVLFLVVQMILLGNKFSVCDILRYTFGIKLIDGYKWYIIATIILYSGFYFMFKYLKRRKAILGIFFLITAYCLICRRVGNGEWWYNATYCFLIGILFGAYYKSIFALIKKEYGMITLVMLTVFILTFNLNIDAGNILTAIVSSAFFVLVWACLLMKIELGNNVINFLGSISYEIYLVQRIILDGLSKINNEYIYLIVCILTCILVAYVFSLFVKKIINIYMSIIKKNQMQPQI